MPTTTQTATLTSALTGTDCKIIIAMLMLQRSIAASSLANIIGRSRQTTASALDHLVNLGLAQNHGAGNAGKWTLTVQARQFILGESQPTLEKFSDVSLSVKKVNTDHGHVSHGLNLNPKPLKTLDIHDHGSVKKVNIDADAQATVDALISLGRYETTSNGKGARDSVEAAIETGWTGTQCLECVIGWQEHFETSAWQPGSLGGYIAYKLRNCQAAPKPKPDPLQYVEGKYEEYIQH